MFPASGPSWLFPRRRMEPSWPALATEGLGCGSQSQAPLWGMCVTFSVRGCASVQRPC